MTGIAATSLAYEQDWNRDKFEIDLPLSLPFQQASAAAYTCKIGRDLERTCSRISVHYYETSYDTCRGTNIVWPLIGSKFAKNGWKLGKVGKTRCTWPFQANNRYDVRLANRRAPGVWFVLCFILYLFSGQKSPGIPVVGDNPLFYFSRILV